MRYLPLFVFIPIFLLIGLTDKTYSQQSGQVLDEIVAVVNDNIILRSDIDARINEILASQRGFEYSDRLWYDVLDNVIDNYVMFEQAKIDSVVVTDDQVSRAMDQQIQRLVAQVGSEEALERALGQSLIQIRSQYRSEFRREMMIDQLRAQKTQSVTITRPEIIEFFNSIPQDSIPIIPETVELSHIVIVPPTKEAARDAAFERASVLRDSLINHGAEFEALARRHSDGPGAANGGFLPLMPLSDLVSQYAAAAAALQPGEISEVVETRFGFHVIRLNRRVGDQIETNHILIQIQEDELDEEFARDKLLAIADSVNTHNQRFADLARRHSEDQSTSQRGGRIFNPQTGQRRLIVEELDPALYRAILNLEEGEISDPVRFTIGQANNRQQAYRIVMLNKRLPEHAANLEQDYDIIANFALQDKRNRVMERWVNQMRENVYVEYRVDNPYSSLR